MSEQLADPAIAGYNELKTMDRTNPIVRQRLLLFEVRRQPVPKCPTCGSPDMVIKHKHEDGSIFWSCKLYPHCWGKIDISEFILDERMPA